MRKTYLTTTSARGSGGPPGQPTARCARRHASRLHRHPARRIIKEIKANHEAQTPEALARNCLLIRELNINIAAVPAPGGVAGTGLACICAACYSCQECARHRAGAC